MIDPTLSRADRMVGQVLGSVNALPEIFTELEISYFLLRRLLGVRTEGDKKGAKVQKLSKNEVLMVNIGSLSTGGRVLAVKADLAKISLTNPVCTEVGEKIALSRRVEKHWRYNTFENLFLSFLIDLIELIFFLNWQVDWLGSNSSWSYHRSREEVIPNSPRQLLTLFSKLFWRKPWDIWPEVACWIHLPRKKIFKFYDFISKDIVYSVHGCGCETNTEKKDDKTNGIGV